MPGGEPHVLLQGVEPYLTGREGTWKVWSEKIMLEYMDPEEMSLDLRGVVETMFW